MLRAMPDAVRVVYGTQATWGVLDVADVALFEQAQVYGVEQELSVATGLLTGLSRGDTLTAAGTSYTLMMPPQRQKDGTTLLALGNA